jgi:hypothetical protein
MNQVTNRVTLQWCHEQTSYLITATEHAFPLHAPMMNENRELSLAIEGRTVCVCTQHSHMTLTPVVR